MPTARAAQPAPIYILDEVDAALDLSHTQNIGRMIRTHFPYSQFIVVSLKEGMFNNANVIFRTKVRCAAACARAARAALTRPCAAPPVCGRRVDRNAHHSGAQGCGAAGRQPGTCRPARGAVRCHAATSR